MRSKTFKPQYVDHQGNLWFSISFTVDISYDMAGMFRPDYEQMKIIGTDFNAKFRMINSMTVFQNEMYASSIRSIYRLHSKDNTISGAYFQELIEWDVEGKEMEFKKVVPLRAPMSSDSFNPCLLVYGKLAR